MAASQGLASVLHSTTSGVVAACSASLSASAVAAAAALAAGPLASSAGTYAERVALCDAALLHRVPVPDLAPGILTPIGGLRKTYKHHSVVPKGIPSVYSTKNLTISTIRSLVLSFQPLVHGWLEQLREAEDAAVEQNLPPPDVPPFPDTRPAWDATGDALCRDLVTQSIRRGLELAAFHFLDPRWAWKLIKDVRKSAVRKAARGMSNLELMTRVPITVTRGNCLGFASDAIVSEALLLYRFICARWRAHELHQQSGPADELAKHLRGTGMDEKEAKTLAKHYQTAWLARQTAFNLSSVAVRCTGAAMGAGLMCLLHPDYGTHAGIVLGDLVAGTVLQLQMGDWASQ